MRLVIGACLVLLSLTTRAQTSDWIDGSIVLSNSDVIRGELSRIGHDVVVVRNAQGTTVLTAHRVTSFRFYDRKNNINRKFISLKSGRHQKFFEQVMTGRITVVREQQSFRQAIDEKNQEQFEYYIASNNSLVSLKSFRHHYYNSIRSELGDSAKDFRQLNPNTPSGALKLIKLYNAQSEAVVMR